MACPFRFIKMLAWLLEYQWKTGHIVWEGQVAVDCTLGSSRWPRRFFIDGKEAFYFNPRVGLLTLSSYGASIVFNAMPKHFKRVVVRGDEFKKHVKGSVLAPIVINITNDVRRGDEVFVTDEEDKPLAVGKSLLGSYEFNTGVSRGEVVRIRRRLHDG